MNRPDSSTLTLTPQDEGMELTHEEFAEAEFQEPWRYERAQGRLVVMTPAGFEHNAAGQPFRNHLGAYMLSHPGIIEYLLPESWIVIDAETERIADIAVYLHSEHEHRASPERVPDLVFEIVSSTAADRRRDYEEKRAEYERIGVREYIIVDRFEHRLVVLGLKEGAYEEKTLGPTEVYTSSLLPGLEIPLEGIL